MNNAFKYMIMNSDELADYIIKYFKAEIDRGFDPNDEIVQKRVFFQAGGDMNDLLFYDRQRVIREVERYCNY